MIVIEAAHYQGVIVSWGILPSMDQLAANSNEILAIVGPTGPSGGAASQYVHTQASPATNWTVNHNLGYIPASVNILSVGGTEIEASIVHTSPNQFVVSFVIPVAGSARVL